MTRKISIFMLVLSMLLISTIDAIAESVTLTPDKILRINFHTPLPMSPVPDTLEFCLGNVVANKYTSISGSLYDNNTLLGIHTYSDFGEYTGPLSLSPASTWKSSESVFTFFEPAVIDFSSIRNGTINGRIDCTIKTGSMTIDFTSVNLFMIQANKSNGGHPSYPDPVITSISIVPEPASALLIGAGLIFIRKRRK